jgi:hypothetical protein
VIIQSTKTTNQKIKIMKQTFFKIRKAVMIIALSGVEIAAWVPSFATDKRIEAIGVTKVQPSIKYIGSDANGSSFLVKVDAAAPVKFEVSIKNNAGIILYNQVFEAADFAKTFHIENAESNNLDLSFTIRTLADNKLHTFNVNSQEKLVTDVVVKKS